jgi:hypothetical protein
MGGAAFIFGQEVRNPGQVPHQSHIDFDLGMIANGMARALYGGADPALATSRAMALIVAYICRGPQCSEPIAGLSELIGYLRTALNFASPGSSLE